MKAVFADAFYFVGLLNRADEHHGKVVAAAQQLHDDIVTTEWILAEFADALAKSANRRLVAQFIRELEQDPKARIVLASTELFRRGLQLYDERGDKKWSLTDCISFVVMKDEASTTRSRATSISSRLGSTRCSSRHQAGSQRSSLARRLANCSTRFDFSV